MERIIKNNPLKKANRDQRTLGTCRTFIG